MTSLRDNKLETANKPDSPWQNRFLESFNYKLRDEGLICEWFIFPPRCDAWTG
jgi:hypothetical protein